MDWIRVCEQKVVPACFRSSSGVNLHPPFVIGLNLDVGAIPLIGMNRDNPDDRWEQAWFTGAPVLDEV